MESDGGYSNGIQCGCKGLDDPLTSLALNGCSRRTFGILECEPPSVVA